MKKSFLIIVLASIIAFSVSGCKQQFFPPLPLVSSGSSAAISPALAVDPEGYKHIVWVEGSGSNNQVIYWKTWFNVPVITRVKASPNSVKPDIAVTDDGDAYVVWSVLDSPNPTQYCYRLIRHTGEVLDNPCFQCGSSSTGNGIQVIARANVAYAVYECSNHLHYVKLSGESEQGVLEYFPPGRTLKNMRLAIDSNAKLHVAWMENGDTNGCIFYDSNAQDHGYFRTFCNPDHASYAITTFSPSSSNERIYLSKQIDDVNNDTLRYYHWLASDGSDQQYVDVPLWTGCNWSIQEIQSLGLSSILFIAFIGRSSCSSGTIPQEVYYYNGYGNNQVNQISEIDFYPKQDLHLVSASDTLNLPVLGWSRKGTSGNNQEMYAAWLSLIGSEVAMKVTQIFTPYADVVSSGTDMASNGDWVAGVWTSQLSPTNSRIVPWLSGNSYNASLPLIRK